MFEVHGTDFALKQHGAVNFEGASMRHPRDRMFELRLTQHMMDLFAKGHVVNFGRHGKIGRTRHLGIIPIGMIHYSSACGNGDNHFGLGRKILAAGTSDRHGVMLLCRTNKDMDLTSSSPSKRDRLLFIGNKKNVLFLPLENPESK